MKVCIVCCNYLHSTSFYNKQSACKVCVKRRVKNNPNNGLYYRSKKGVVRTIYKTQRLHSKTRNHSYPAYSKEELKVWLYQHGFEKLFNEWEMSGYKKDMKPSVNRLDDSKPYTIDNIELITWLDNRKKQYNCNIIGAHGSSCKPVCQYTFDGDHVASYHSQNEAARQTGVCAKSISACITGKRKSTGGFVWK